MVFRASKLPQNHTFHFDVPFEEINTHTSDNIQLNSILFKANESKGVLFYLHGNAGNLEQWGQQASIFTAMGYDIWMTDYRGFGKSTGEVIDQAQVYSDLELIYSDVQKRYKEHKIIICGYSIGTGPAAYLASKFQPKALVLQAPYFNFTTYTDGAAPYFPDFLKKFSFPTNTYLPKIKAPMALFHGDDDHLIPLYHSKQLQQFFKPKDTLIVLPNQSHIGINQNSDFQAGLNHFLSNL
ncbi:alpha/beta hydrolase [Flavobacterium sp.]|jgi:pimeloyl-ACP methyl ester carboxylesterase|nr:alpha/beta hydrolase [Flavobacterium sp.]MCZ8167623.1 alpha/beta hydrolase [Flavobacterium sp.]MCZ8295698.1 alpha/beta hydrolase [Flavobacterium sp.]